MAMQAALLAGLLCVTAPAGAGEAVTLQLKWTHAFQFAGYYPPKPRATTATPGWT
jgi:hypothetical protein